MSEAVAQLQAAVEVVNARRRRNIAQQHTDAAYAALIDAARAAHAAGVPQTLIAEAAGVTRLTVHRWLREGR